jgi:hypothetical protein
MSKDINFNMSQPKTGHVVFHTDALECTQVHILD